MNRFNFLYVPLFLVTIMSCSEEVIETSVVSDIPKVSVEKSVTISPKERFQTIKGFAASDCWSAAYIGKSWVNSRDKITELLFSSEIIDGSPKGIALSQWRVNLGGGTAEQGDASRIADKSRRTSSYLNDDGTYDWSRCEGQRYFMSRAKEFGCNNIIVFSNTPPVQYTKNGLGFSESGRLSNLRDDCYDDYANYIAKVLSFYKEEGYNVTHISPVNEPQFDWGPDANGVGGSEGTGWTNENVANIARELDRALTEKGLTDTRMLIGEAGSWDCLYKIVDDAGRSNVINAFFNPSNSSTFIGNLTHMDNLICGHSYWTDGTWKVMQDVRKQLHDAAEANDIEVWQSEWSMLGNGYSSSEFVGFDAATEMDIALYMSKVIHNDLTIAQVTSWSFWTAIDAARWGHKNRFLLIDIVPQGGIYSDFEIEGTFRATPTLWVLGNFSRFVRPGYQRIKLKLKESMYFFGSGYISPDGKEIVAVYSNLSDKAIRLAEKRENWDAEPSTIKIYTTSASKNLKEKVISNGDTIYLDAKSVTTVVYQFD